MADNRIKRSQNKSCVSKVLDHKWNIPPQPEAKKSDDPIEALFDSGYDSQTVSKTSIQLESELNPTEKSQKWTDSGLSITSDSGLNIDEEFSDKESHKKLTKSANFSSIELLREAYEPDQDGDTYLHLSIIEGLQDVSYSLIHVVPHPDFLDIFNHLLQSPLHLSALTRQPNIVRRLIISGATVDLRDRHGNTALHIACAQSDLESVVRILTPITEKETMDAKVVNYPVSARHLPKEFLELKNYEGETCLHLAAYSNNKNIIEYLVKCGANVNAQEGKSGKSVLHWSVETKNPDLVQFLVNRCKADVNLRSYAGRTPLHLAWMLLAVQPNSSKLKQIIKYLRECGAEPSRQPNIDSESDSSSDEE